MQKNGVEFNLFDIWCAQTLCEFIGNYIAKNGVELSLFDIWFVQNLCEFLGNYFAKMV